MTNDILEQLTEDHLREKGYFTQHNIKYRPNISSMVLQQKRLHAVHSDMDILAINPNKRNLSKVIVVNCKSWQNGLDINKFIKAYSTDPKRLSSGKEIWKYFREITSTEWGRALKEKVKELTGADNFIFRVAVTKYLGKKEDWEKFDVFNKTLTGCKIELIDLETMISEIQNEIDTTPSHSELSRLIQLIKASKGKIVY